MFSNWQNWLRDYILRKSRIDKALWERSCSQIRAIAHLSPIDLERLRDLASLFLHEKSIEPAGELVLTEIMAVRIACEACIPILNLDLEDYNHWHSIILYPDEFVTRHENVDENGVVHVGRDAYSGEAWDSGPVILSWQNIIAGEPGSNVIIHEMAHKLDLLDGIANGRPPLHRDMDQAIWAKALSAAYEMHVAQVEAEEETVIDAYAAEDPAEFFAVMSEVFFESAHVLRRQWPAVYEQLAQYYRQRPDG